MDEKITNPAVDLESKTSNDHPGVSRYTDGKYVINVSDEEWKAQQMSDLIQHIPNLDKIESYADVGTGTGKVFINIVKYLAEYNIKFDRNTGYDVAPFTDTETTYPHNTELRQEDYLRSNMDYDLVTLNDVVEHVATPVEFLEKISHRSKYVALHIPLDDRLSVLLTNQYNFRLGPVGHINFWSPASALTMLTSSGLVPVYCKFTPGFMAPTGRERLSQRIAYPFRWLIWKVSPGLAASTIGGVSLAVLCRGRVD